MAVAVIWTESAWADLDAVASFIAKDSKRYASSFVADARASARSSAIFPRIGRVVPEFHEADLREVFINNYRMLYRFRYKRVHVVTLVHAARDLPSYRQEKDF